MYTKTQYIILALFISSIYATAQQSLNFDFEKLSVEGLARPWGWSVQYYSANFEYTCDTTVVHKGNNSLKMSNAVQGDTSLFELGFFIEPSQLLNKQLTIRGWIKTNGLNGEAGVRLSSIGAIGDEYGTLQEVKKKVETPTSDWQAYELSLKVEGQPHSIFVTTYCAGSGTIWYDDFQLSIDDVKVNEVAVAPEFTNDQQQWLNDKVKPFSRVNPATTPLIDKADFKDLAPFKAMVGDAKIIALGEATHGTSEFFKVKHRLLQYAISELGVRVFILEDNQLLVERINEYVLEGIGEAEDVMKGLFAVWNTEEMLAMIKWIRAYNEEHPDTKVEFVGMDIQNPRLAFEKLDHFLGERDTLLQTQSAQLLSDLKSDWRTSYYQSDSTLGVWTKAAQENYELIKNKSNEWLKNSSSSTTDNAIIWGVQYAKFILQYTQSASTGAFDGRDKAMAENVSWILGQRPPDTRAIVWAHDSHISRGEAKIKEHNYFLGLSMGSHLSKKYGEDYRAFGLSTYEGTCLGTISYSNFKQSAFDIYTSPKGSLDQGLHQSSVHTSSPFLMLDLKTAKENADQYQWLALARPVRYVGYVAEDYGFGGRHAIPYQFDGVIFIDRSSAAHRHR